MKNKQLCQFLVFTGIYLGLSLVVLGIFISAFDEMPKPISYKSRNKMENSIDKCIFEEYSGNISPNTASIQELIIIPGIGEKTAQAIIDEREKNGPFYYLQDLIAVKGIGNKKLEQISAYLTLP